MPLTLLANENILDLRGLLDEQESLTIIDVQGREWRIAADLPLRTALGLLQYAQRWEQGELDADSFNATVDGMHAILRRCTPSVTRDEVLDGFSVNDMIAAISFLSFRLRARAQQPNGAEPQTEPEPAHLERERDRTRGRAATRKPSSLPSASPVET